MNSSSNFLDALKFDENGLITAIAQDHQTNKILMVAWMNQHALQTTIETGFATYFSRSRAKLWHKGEESGNQQRIIEIRLDCDGDVLLLKVEQIGGVACHTGRESCFFYCLSGDPPSWRVTEPVLKNPNDMYRHPK